ncbi:MAG: phosphotransferase [Planctomycetota bacterium]
MSPQWVDESTLTEVEGLLRRQGMITDSENIVSLDKAGEGNMNVTLRARVGGTGTSRSLIVKQSRPFVAKYEQIEAPLERIEYENAFYEFIEQHGVLARRMPKKLAWNSDQRLLVLEDLGSAADASSWYWEAPTNLATEVKALLAWITKLHAISAECDDKSAFQLKFANTKLRALNHAHIFDIPFQSVPAIPLDEVCPGLDEATKGTRENSSLRNRVSELGKLYLSDGEVLLHGDFYPGSWLIGDSISYVIDPEFCFAGSAEFDLGVLLAHLGLIDREQSELVFRPLIEGLDGQPDMRLVDEFAATEILRRLLGVAQLPLRATLEERLSLIEASEAILIR